MATPDLPVAPNGDEPVHVILTGGATSDKLQGYDTDDTSTGNGGADLFSITLGNDVITDFDPAADLLDFGDFARAEGEFETLRSLSDVKAAATEIIGDDGTISLVIDIDGDLGDSTTTLLGVSLADLTDENVFFGSDETAIPPLEFTHIASYRFEYAESDAAEVAATAVHAEEPEEQDPNDEDIDGIPRNQTDEDDEGGSPEPDITSVPEETVFVIDEGALDSYNLLSFSLVDLSQVNFDF